MPIKVLDIKKASYTDAFFIQYTYDLVKIAKRLSRFDG